MPTARELLLLILLLVSLLFFSSNNAPSSHTPQQLDLKRRDADALSKRWIDRVYEPITSTEVVAHVPGWTILDNFYVLNGTFYVVTDEPTKVPDVEFIVSKGLAITTGADAEAARLPSAKDIQIVTPKEALALFGKSVQTFDGVTFLVNDPPQYVTHYYHFCAELFFGFWRTYTFLDPRIYTGSTALPPPKRMMFTRLDSDHWRDYASMNQYILRSAFPSVSLSFDHDWSDMASSGWVYKFSRAVLADRSAGMIGYNYQRSQRTASLPFALPGPPSFSWWLTIRNNVVQIAGLSPSVGDGTLSNPVITYVSRQTWGRRMLKQEDHERLVKSLEGLRDKYGWEINIVVMDKMSRVEQLQLAARTTILMGVHGNALTSLLWMKPTPRSTVMEFFYPGGFAHDYEFTTRALGMVHYGFWNSEFFTSPSTPLPSYPEGFQGNSIPIDGEAVARLCVERLTLAAELDD